MEPTTPGADPAGTEPAEVARAAAVTRPLTVKEQTLWTLQRLAPHAGMSNEALAVCVAGRLQVSALTHSFRHLVRRHPALRTTFPELRGEPVAVVLPADQVAPDIPVRGPDHGRLVDQLRAVAGEPFALARELPVRAALVRYPRVDAFVVAFHHLAYDAWTAGLLQQELTACYDALSAGAPLPAALAGPAGEYVEPAPSAAAVDYWRRRLAGFEPASSVLAIGRPDPPHPTFAGGVLTWPLGATARAAVRRLARRLRCTENIVLLAAYYALLAAHGGGPDMVIGVTVDARDPSVTTAAGYHVNTLPLREGLDPAESFEALAARVRDSFLAAIAHRQVPYEVVLPDLESLGAGWRTPVFRHTYNYRPVPIATEARFGGLAARSIQVDTGHSRQDLELIVEADQDRIALRVVYSSEILDAADVRALVQRYDALLCRAGAEPDRSLAELAGWSSADRAVVVGAHAGGHAGPHAGGHAGPHAGGHAGAPAAPPAGSLPELVAAAHRRRGSESVALVDDRRYTYREVLAAAAEVGQRLRAAGVRPGEVVGLAADRGFGLAAAVLGVWQARAAYLPLSRENPAEVVRERLAEVRVAAVLTDRPPPESWQLRCPVLAMPAGDGSGPDDRFDASPCEPDSPAGVVYTAGSGGRPRPVVLTHGNLAAVVRDVAARVALGSGTGVSWLSPFVAPVSALELLLPLCYGGRAVVAPDDARGRAEVLTEVVLRHDVAVVSATASTWAAVVGGAGDAFAGRWLLCYGEPVTPPLARSLLETGARVLNVYGHAETAGWCAVDELRAGEPVTVGRPVAGTVLRVQDERGRALPPGVRGELCVAGPPVARGYHGAAATLAADHFGETAETGRYLRTGDRASWRHDGRIELHGRLDRQWGAGPRRIDPGQLETVLASHPAVLATAAVLRPDAAGVGRPVGIVWVPPAGGDRAEVADELGRLARQRLPGHAVPAQIAVLREWPVTDQGRTDYTRLAGTPLAGPGADPAEPGGARPEAELTGILVELWRDALDEPELDSTSHFFLAGGNSMVAVRLLSGVERRLGVSLTLGTLLDAPTPAALARHLADHRPRAGSGEPAR